MREFREHYQVVVIGGGLAGVCAAISSARGGVSTCLVQNRPVLGGNSSSEIRVTPHGAAAFHAYARETGIISELLIEERARNHEEIFENGWTNSVWDMVLYDAVMRTDGLTLHLNTDVYDVVMHDRRKIRAIKARVLNAETELYIEGDIFIDCSGDGVVADKSGCEWRMGSEARSEFGEIHAPEEASEDVMGSSIHFKTKQFDHEVPFMAPDWAVKYEDASFFYNNGRPPKQVKGGYWWLEIGVPYHTIDQNEEIRHLLTCHALGVWDWMKNRDPKTKELTRNWALDWIGQVPGKRESRRIMGRYLMTENDAQQGRHFDDEIAFGGWFIDIHTPGGLLAHNSEPASGENYNTFTDYAVQSYAGPYGIPLGTLVAKDVDNLMMAGRNVSVTHAMFGSVRVMGTGSLLGQAAGTAAVWALKEGACPGAISPEGIRAVRQRLLRDGCFLLNCRNEDPGDLAPKATVSATSEASEYGAGPSDNGEGNGLAVWTDQPQYTETKIETRRGQLIAVGTDHIDTISICVSNRSGKPQKLEYSILKPDHIFDYRIESLPELVRGVADVPPGDAVWIPLQIGLTGLESGGWIRLDVEPNPDIEWHTAGKVVSGHVSVYRIAADKMRRFGSGHTLSFRTVPAQPCYRAANVTNGVTRPMAYTNLWKSDPAQPFPQSLRLDWDAEQRIDTIEITFPGHLLRELHAYAPFYRDPQCPKSYTVEALCDDKWVEIVRNMDNYHRHVRHAIDKTVACKSVRVNILATNGDRSAQIYEIRCYKDR